METYYLIDFENVQPNMESVKKTDHVHVFYTQDAKNIPDKKEIERHKVPSGKQSLDMHLVSYLGYLLAIHDKACRYVIVSKDTDYDNIIKFWKEKGYPNIARDDKMPANNKKTGPGKGGRPKAEHRSESTVKPKSGAPKDKESEVRSLFGKHFKKAIYVEKKEEIIQIILQAETKLQVKNDLLRLHLECVSAHIFETVQKWPVIADLPER
mgnify:CR=1 FL=1